MAITKMVAVTVLGKLSEFENIVDKYVYNQSIHLENALTVLGDKKHLSSFEEGTQYDTVVKTAEDILKTCGITPKVEDCGDCKLSIDDMKNELSEITDNISDGKKTRDELVKQKADNEEYIKYLSYAKKIDCDLKQIFNMEYIRARFGHMPAGGYKMLNTYLNDMEAVLVETCRADTEVWGFYFAPESNGDEVNRVFDSLYFEQIFLPGDIEGTPEQVTAELYRRNEEIDKKLGEIASDVSANMDKSKDELIRIYSLARKRQQFTDVLANAAHSKDFFYIVGWMSEKDAKDMKKKTRSDEGILMFYTEKAENLKNIITPPTKLKNNPVFRPFEFFVKMYGLPGYEEIDPTPLLAVTYILFFGMMFGDVGQSALLALGGFLIYKFKKIDLANIIGICGLSGMIFGVLYGSVFGKEDIIKGIIPPMDNITTLLITTIAMGAVIIVIGILLNIRNCLDKGEKGEMIFGHNGIAGLVFYVSVIIFALSKFVPAIKVPSGLMIALIVVSLLAIFLKEPLIALTEGKKDWLPKGGMFYVQSFFELFEVLLSYFSNTISFLRIGAFAIVHVGMMMAVEMLASGGTVKVIIVSILGNLLVMVMEGLVVGIQVLRLEYYEMFSRYFTGNGKPFESLRIK